MYHNVNGFSGFGDIGEAALDFINSFGYSKNGVWKTGLIPKPVHASLIAAVNKHTYPEKNMKLIIRKWIVMHTTSKGMCSEFNFMFN